MIPVKKSVKEPRILNPEDTATRQARDSVLVFPPAPSVKKEPRIVEPKGSLSFPPGTNTSNAGLDDAMVSKQADLN